MFCLKEGRSGFKVYPMNTHWEDTLAGTPVHHMKKLLYHEACTLQNPALDVLGERVAGIQQRG